ncbi:MAG: hypothetical protein ACE15F_06505 [bacterium]
MVTFPAILVLGVIITLLVAVTASRTVFMARATQRLYMVQQADWLARGAVERALVELSRAKDPADVTGKDYTERIAPVFVDADPLDEPADAENSGRVITATYRYRLVPAGPQLLETGESTGFILTGLCEIPYRQTTLSRSKTYLCTRDAGNRWRLRPLVETNPRP